MKAKLPLRREYVEFVTELKQRIASARLHAARAVNRDLILLYWDIGRGILERQEKLGWGQSVVIERVQQFILELGYGICFIGRQHRLSLGKTDFFIDLLF
jgi:predicted nuclease of restriction endonuclease-like (RecB) superfamily